MLKFFEENRDIDVFCLQELWSAPFTVFEGKMAGGMPLTHDGVMVHGKQEIAEVLGEHTVYFRPRLLDDYGLGIYIKNNIEVLDEGELFVHKAKGYIPEGDIGMHACNLQFVTLATDFGPRTIVNFHGLWNGRGKGDSDDRLLQSDRMVAFFKTLTNPLVVCGDFNLLPETESLKKLKSFGLRNLITENNITSTRTSFYTKPNKFADYTLVSDGIKVNEFRILSDEVSDHSPMYLEFN